MTKEEFLIQYILNRAKGHTGGLDGASAVVSGETAWNEIQKRKGKSL